MLHRYIEGGRVGDDGGEVVGEDCGDDDGGHGGPWPPWHCRGMSPSEIGSVSLSLSVSVFFWLPFHRFVYIYMEIRNSDSTVIFAVIFS